MRVSVGWLASCLVGLLSLAMGCAQGAESATALAVSVKTDLREELSTVWYGVYPVGADPRRDPPTSEQSAGATDLGRPFVIVKGTQPELLLVVEARDAVRTRVATRARLRFEEGKTLAVHVFLGRTCLDKPCTDLPGQSCYTEPLGGVQAGACGPTPLREGLPEVTRPGEEGAWQPTASIAMDAGVDGALPSTSDSGAPGACVMRRPGDVCNAVTQCGCEPGQSCRYVGAGENAKPGCGEAGPRGAYERCETLSDCAPGHQCEQNVCQKYCLTADDCTPGSLCIGVEEYGAGFCLTRCDRARGGAPCGAFSLCNSLRAPGVTGEFCMVPQDPCMSQGDGACDEPEIGTGLCAAGTDKVDCCQLDRPFCDLYTQCGCKPELACQIIATSGQTANLGCRAPGLVTRGNPCAGSEECTKGLVCANLRCTPVCKTDADCPNGKCFASAHTGVSVCIDRCDFETGAPCGAGLSCIRGSSGDFCGTSLSPCPRSGNGVCDETTRYCAPGTDADCPR